MPSLKGVATGLSAGALALCFPLRVVKGIIDECGRASQRARDLHAAVTGWHVIAMNLFPAAGCGTVLGWLINEMLLLSKATVLGVPPVGFPHVSRRRPFSQKPCRLLKFQTGPAFHSALFLNPFPSGCEIRRPFRNVPAGDGLRCSGFLFGRRRCR